MDDTAKQDLIRKIVNIQAENADDELGDRNLADPEMALEAIDAVLDWAAAGTGTPSNGALRQYLEAMEATP